MLHLKCGGDANLCWLKARDSTRSAHRSTCRLFQVEVAKRADVNPNTASRSLSGNPDGTREVMPVGWPASSSRRRPPSRRSQMSSIVALAISLALIPSCSVAYIKAIRPRQPARDWNTEWL